MASILTGTPLTYTGDMAMDYIIRPAVTTGRIEDFMKVVFGVKTKQTVIFADPIYKITRVDPGCGSGPNNPVVNRTQKSWEPQDVEAWVDQCYADLKGTLHEAQLKSGNDKPDLTNTKIEKFLLDLLEPAAYSDFLRMAWLSKKGINAAELTNGAADQPHYNQIDGIWTKIFQAVAANLIPRIAISENANLAGANADGQDLPPDAALGYLKKVHKNQSTILKQVAKDKKVHYVTRDFYDNLLESYESNKQLETSFTKLQDGQDTLAYRGVPLVIVDIVDQFLESDFNVGGKITMKHRVILTVKDNFQIGLDGDTTDPTAMMVWYNIDKKTWNARLNYKLAAMIAQETYVSVAY